MKDKDKLELKNMDNRIDDDALDEVVGGVDSAAHKKSMNSDRFKPVKNDRFKKL